MKMSLLFFSLRTAQGCKRVPLAPLQVKEVLISPKRITIHCHDGCKHVNMNPTPKEVAFWTGFKIPPSVKPTRWDMATPDPLAIAALEEYELK